MKISDLIIDDKESIILAANLLGKSFIKFCNDHKYYNLAMLIKVCLDEPDRISIICDILYVIGSFGSCPLYKIKSIITEYELPKCN